MPVKLEGEDGDLGGGRRRDGLLIFSHEHSSLEKRREGKQEKKGKGKVR